MKLRITMLTAIAAFFFKGAALAQADFSGNWVINYAKSDINDTLKHVVPKKMQVTQKEPDFQLSAGATGAGITANSGPKRYKLINEVTAVAENGGDSVDTQKLTIGGGYTKYMMAGHIKMKEKTYFDRNQTFLIFDELMADKKGNYSLVSTTTWNLSADGRTLSYHKEAKYSDKKYQLTAVFDKN